MERAIGASTSDLNSFLAIKNKGGKFYVKILCFRCR